MKNTLSQVARGLRPSTDAENIAFLEAKEHEPKQPLPDLDWIVALYQEFVSDDLFIQRSVGRARLC